MPNSQIILFFVLLLCAASVKAEEADSTQVERPSFSMTPT